MLKKIHTLPEAEKMMPYLKVLTGLIQDTWTSIVELRSQLDKFEGDKEIAEEIRADLNELISRVNGYIKEIEDLGVYVQEFKRGVLSIPTLFHGRKVFLCPTPTENPNVDYFHELDETYQDRQLIGANRKHFLLERI